jgi:serine/threonine protein kinase
MTDITYPTTPIKSSVRRVNAPPLGYQPGEGGIDSIMGMTDTVSSASAVKSGIRRTNTLSSGHLLDEYRIDCTLGAGGFGVTYKAWDTLLETWVAIKEYFPVEWSFRDADGVTVHANTQGGDIGGGDGVSDYLWGLERFLDEARVLARVQHPFVVRVKRYFRAHGTAYIVMDYEEGEPLNAVLQDGETLGEAEVRGLLEDVLPALQAVHEQGFLHRDLKPSNLYVRASDHRVILIDFGAAREAVGRHSKSVTSLVTPGYSPPEQYTTRNDRYGTWTDVYALGAVLYRCVTGRPPTEAAERLLEDTLEPAARAGAGRYSADLLRVIDRALAVRPEQRFATVAEMRAALDRSQDPNENGNSDSDSDETVILGFLSELTGPDKPHLAGSPLTPSVEGIANEDWLEISQPPTVSRQRADRGQDAMRSPPDVDLSGRRRLSRALIGISLVLATLVVLAARVIWVWPSTPMRQEPFPVPYTLEQERHLAKPADTDSSFSIDHPLPVSTSVPVRASDSVAVEAVPEVSPTVVEPPALAQPSGADVEQGPPLESEDLSARPVPNPPSPERALEPATENTALLPTPNPASNANANARTGSATEQAARNPTAGEARPRRSGESSARSRDSTRQAGRTQSRPRSGVANFRSGFKFWRKWRAVRNPWEPPARTGFNQR